MSLGSLSAASCDLLCSEARGGREPMCMGQGREPPRSLRSQASKGGDVTLPECEAFLQSQRQVCMYRSTAQVAKIDAALMALGLRGVTILGSSGDGGSHWSFGKFPSTSKVGRALNKVGCEFMFPIYPSPSPYMVSVGGTEWERGDPTKPVMWQAALATAASPPPRTAPPAAPSARPAARPQCVPARAGLRRRLGRRLLVAVRAARLPEGSGHQVPRRRGHAARHLLQRLGPRVPRYQRRGGGRHLAVVALLRGHLARASPSRRLPVASPPLAAACSPRARPAAGRSSWTRG